MAKKPSAPKPGKPATKKPDIKTAAPPPSGAPTTTSTTPASTASTDPDTSTPSGKVVGKATGTAAGKATGKTAGKATGGSKATAIFTTGSDMDRTKVLTFKDGKPFYKVYVEPIEGDKPISNADKASVDKKGASDKALSAIVTALNLQTEVRQQLNYTLGKTIYMYIFGESVYYLTLSGFAYKPCKSTANNFVEDILSFYENNNVGKTGKYCKITLGDRVFKGYLTSSEIGLTAETPSLAAFKFNFVGIFDESK